MNPKDAPFEAMKNRKRLQGACGCFKCLEKFDVSEITEWTDNSETAICPRCGADSVLNDAQNLESVHTFWFGDN